MSEVSKIKLLKGGRTGAIVSYQKLERVGDFDHNNANIKTNKSVVPGEMLAIFRAMRIHLLRNCSLWQPLWDDKYDFVKNEVKDNASQGFKDMVKDCMINQIDFYSNGFALHGTFPRPDGIVSVKLNSEPVTEDHGYQYFDECMTLLEELAALAVKYAENEIVASSEEVKMTVIGSLSPELSEKDIKKIVEDTDSEVMENIINEFNEKNGRISLSLDELLDPPADDDQVVEKMEAVQDVEEVPAEEPVVDKTEADPEPPEEVPVVEAEEAPKTEKKPSKKKEPVAKAADVEEPVTIPSEEEEGF